MRERRRLLTAIADRGERSGGRDDRTRQRTVGQRKNQEAFRTSLMRGNVTWGTPIVEGTPE